MNKHLLYTAAISLLILPAAAFSQTAGSNLLPNLSSSIFDMFDTDGDGKVSKTEYELVVMAHFDKLDADGDGMISKEEAKMSVGNNLQKRRAIKERVQQKLEQRRQNRQNGGVQQPKVPPQAPVPGSTSGGSPVPGATQPSGGEAVPPAGTGGEALPPEGGTEGSPVEPTPSESTPGGMEATPLPM